MLVVKLQMLISNLGWEKFVALFAGGGCYISGSTPQQYKPAVLLVYANLPVRTGTNGTLCVENLRAKCENKLVAATHTCS
jgi:hypothetical protein